ncbi:MAG: DapH/DapD/GlmU-related protein [Gemmatimonadales bacterium]
MRLFVCEPLFKAYCTSYGRNVRTGVYVHFVQGRGELLIGNDVEVRGKCSFTFAARFEDRPVLRIGNNTNIGHNCSFVVGRGITIGDNCLIASGVAMYDSNGHPSDPVARLRGLPPTLDDVKPITVHDNVWIGQRVIVSPGVTIGENSIVSAGSVVVSDVPANVVVAGYPARRIANLNPPGSPTAGTSATP